MMKCGLVSGATYLFAHGSNYNETGLCLSLSMLAIKAHSQSILQLLLLLLHLIAVKSRADFEHFKKKLLYGTYMFVIVFRF